MSENLHPDWPKVFEILFTYRRQKGQVRHYREYAAKTAYQPEDIAFYRYFGRAEIAFRIGWPDEVKDPDKVMTVVRTEAQHQGLRYTDESSLPKGDEYRKCWEALVAWCQSNDAWKPYADEMGKRLRDRLKDSGEPESQPDAEEPAGPVEQAPILQVWTAMKSASNWRSLLQRSAPEAPAWQRNVDFLFLGVAITLVATVLGLAGIDLVVTQANQQPQRYFSTFGTEIPAHDDPVLSLAKEVKPASADRSRYVHSIQAKVHDVLTITSYVYNPRSGTVYHGGRLYDELPQGGGTVTLRSSLTFADPEVQRESSVTITIPATAHLEYLNGCDCPAMATSVRIDQGNHSGTDLLDSEWRAAYAAVDVLADGAVELNRDGVGAASDHSGRQSV